jgi:hypothetical protein
MTAKPRADAAASYENDLIKRARELQRLATRRRALRRQLKAVDADIRHARKMLNAIKQASAGRRPDIAPSRLHAGVTGYDFGAAKDAAAEEIAAARPDSDTRHREGGAR